MTVQKMINFLYCHDFMYCIFNIVVESGDFALGLSSFTHLHHPPSSPTFITHLHIHPPSSPTFISFACSSLIFFCYLLAASLHALLSNKIFCEEIFSAETACTNRSERNLSQYVHVYIYTMYIVHCTYTHVTCLHWRV